MSEQKQILDNSKIMVVITALSRVFGLVRDQLIAFLLGTTRLGDVWALSFMIPNLFRRLIAEGAMSSAFVPILAELTEQEEEREAIRFMRSIFSLILLSATLIVTIMILILPWVLPALLKLAAVTSTPDPATYARIILPTQLMFPYLIFISLAAICQGVLNVNNRFALPSATPIILNICIISCGYLLRDWQGNPIWGLCCGVLLGGTFQFAVQWVHLYRLGFRIVPVFRFWSERTREAIRLWLPTTFSAGVTQINALVSGMIALNILEGAAIALQTSTRLMELVLGVFTVALSTSMLPVLARQRSRNDQKALNDSTWTALEIMSLVTIPAALGLIFSGPSVIHLLFVRGEFNLRSLDLTYTALIFHAMALIPISWHRILSQTFYAHKQVKIAVIIAAIAAFVNVLACLVLPRFFDPIYRHCGVALATLVSAWVLFFISVWQIHKRFAIVWPRRLNSQLARILLAALAFVPLWQPFAYRIFSPASLLLRIFGSIFIYVLLVWLFRVTGFLHIIRKK